MSEQPRLKVYGLLRLTRRAYLTMQTAGLLLAVAAIALSVCLPRPEVPAGDKMPPFSSFLTVVLNFLPWFGLLVLVYEAAETYLVLQKFNKLEVHPDAVGPASRAGPSDSAARLAAPTEDPRS